MSASTSNPITAGFELFLPPNLGNANSSWAASVINICDNYGTYAMQCTAGSAPSATCGPNAVILTITEAITEFTFATQTATSGTSLSVLETCTINGYANATCVASYKISADGTRTHSAVTTTIDGQAMNTQDFAVNITGGAALLTAGGVCKSAGPQRSSVRGMLTAAVALLGILAVFVL